ncbi:MAG TPA: DEAD/DEAH box helicase, partial [Candidatus Krumholzibacteria bacterium]|nr:DEAD/DEAH box helicase [Candidatus Krumholzibacteria bacterium]
MKKRSFALSCRVHRHPEVRVVRPLAAERDTLFLQGEDERVPEELTLLSLDESTPDGDSIGLQELLLALWPAAISTVDQELKKTRAIDNRVDLEQSLCGWADLLLALQAWWHSLDSPHRHYLKRSLEQLAPIVAEFLALEAPAVSLQVGTHLGRPVSEIFPGIFFAPVPKAPKADEEAWQAWRARGVEEILGENGGLAQILGEGFEARAGQLDMALKLEHVLARDEHLMIEAGTGIGKSLAYLVPALLHGAREDERVVISTYTKALQHQLIEGDLPVLERFGYPAQARLLLGRNNYLCARQFRRAMLHRPESRAEALAQLAIYCWRFQSRDGRREELSDHPFFEDHWLALFESVEPCSPHICLKDPLCFVVAARRSAREAPVVIVNHSLLMMDLRSAQGLLGPSRLLIVDEAHELPPVATNALSHWIRRDRLEVYKNLSGEKTRGGLREVLEEILKIVGEKPGGDRLRECTRALDSSLDSWWNAYHRWFDAVEESCRSRLSEGSARAGRHRYHDGDEAFGAVRAETEVLLTCAEELHQDLAKVLDASGDLAELLPEMQDDREALVSLLSFHSDLCAGIRFCLEASDEDWVYWFEWGGSRGLAAIVAAPLTVEEPL